MWKNKRAGKCMSCKDSVAIGQGYCYKQGHKWLTACASTACHKRLGLSLPQTDDRKEISVDGVVRFPYDPNVVALVKSLPKARFNPSDKTWTVSVEPQHLTRVLEVADQVKLVVPDELRAKNADGTDISRAAEKRAETKGLYEFQKEGVKAIALHDRFLLADDMGLGKTIQTLVALPESPRVLVICPNAVKYNWQAEANVWRKDISTFVVPNKKFFKWPDENEMVIINYDILSEQKDIPEDLILIVDEAHACKNYKTKRHNNVKAIAEKAAKVIFLTGTPIMNRPFDLMGVLSAGNMFRETFGTWNKFCELFSAYRNRFGWSFGMPSPEVPERMKRVMLRRLKKDVLTDLPDKQYSSLKVDLTGSIIEELDKEFSQYKDVLEMGVMPRFEDIAAVRAKLAKNRIPAMLQMVEEYEDMDTPLIVFSAHVAPIEELKFRDGWEIITGSTKAIDRSKIVERFQKGELKGLGLTIAACGIGLTLTHASNILFVDLDWTPALNIQAEDRAHRIGQKNSVNIISMYSDHPLDQRIHELLQFKMEIARRAFDSKIEAKFREGNADMPIKHETDEELQARLNAAEREAEQKYFNVKINSVLERERGKAIYPEPEMTEQRKELISKALDFMIGRCDGAIKKDGVGFNKPDAAIAHWIYKAGLNDVSYRLAERIMSRYSMQLSDYKGIWDPNEI